MKTKILGFLLLLSQLSLAQDTGDAFASGYRAWGIQLGFMRMHTLDRNSSALLYRGNLPTLRLTYENVDPEHQFWGQLEFGRGSFFAGQYPDRAVRFRSEDIYGKVDSVSVPMRGTNTLGQLSLGFMRSLHPDGKLNYRVGGVVSNTLFYPEGFLQPGLMNVASLSPTLGVEMPRMGSQLFSIRITVPVFNLVSRSTYNNSVSQPVDSRVVGFFDQGTRWASFNKHREVRFSAAYQFRWGGRWMSGLHYHFRWLKNTAPRDLTMAQSELGLSFNMIK